MNPLTPMMQQYLALKAQYPDAILFFRLGDFYEMFFEDAQVASRILDIALTSRNKNKEDAVPLCGVPYHAASSYIQKLIDQGYKVAICEQMEDAAQAKGIVRREVTRIITPGMIIDDEFLEPKTNNFILALLIEKDRFALASLDVSTGDFAATEIASLQSLVDEIFRLRPKEILFPEPARRQAPFKEIMKIFPQILYSPLPESVFDEESSRRRMADFGLEPPEGPMDALRAAGGILFYLQETQKTQPRHLSRLWVYRVQDHMVLDETSRRNLEIFENLQTRNRKHSLLDVLDRTVTPMGGRMLRRWLSAPLLDLARIQERLDLVEELKKNDLGRQELREILAKVRDFERLAGKISLGSANARDLVALRDSLTHIPPIKKILHELRHPAFGRMRESLYELPELKDRLDRAIEENPPFSGREGGIIKKGFDADLDHLREISHQGKRWIANLESQERHRTGIASLKVRYNKVFGYYIEVTKPNLSAVPAHYIRKQTLANAERFITPELQEYEHQVLTAEEKKIALEWEIFQRILAETKQWIPQIQSISQVLAQIDIFCGLAEVAEQHGYCRPVVTDRNQLIIVEGRHPVLERSALSERFVPNDLMMNDEKNQILIITGPNMAGKSTIMRQTALIVIMAQMGSFVPAKEAEIGLIDRIFTRVGASDDLARGRSTFMVEMEETAHILNNLTPRSLVLLDEIGRGTSTFDGLSIAWAVTEYLHDVCPYRVKTLFATHYHELTELALTKSRVANYHVAVKEWNEQVIFLRKLVEGPTSRSYGIQVARLAGLPEAVVDRAKEVLANLEQGEFTDGGIPKLALSRKRKIFRGGEQMTLFSAPKDSLREALRALDPNRITPLEALTLICEWKAKFTPEM
jgi:DNA mismatch repair protein MutS